MQATKSEADYTKDGTPSEHCGICRHFEPPAGCTLVEGAVRAQGWCRFFAKDTDERRDAREEPPPGVNTMLQDEYPRAAGMLIRHHHPDIGEQVLFVRHAERGTWEMPGGMIEEGETEAEAAERECFEEIGPCAYSSPSLMMRSQLGGIDFSTFLANAASLFVPKLNEELAEWQWASPESPPEPLHPGLRLALGRLRMNELDLTRAIAAGELPSPQQYENMWLFALRITGTGASFRQELDEYVWRDPSIYLNSEFLARCNGLPVIIQHPESDALNQDEFEQRVIGSIVHPFLEGDEVWGIARVYDQKAAQLMRTKQLSTSPAVVFRDPGVNEIRRLESGRTLLIEGIPSLLDHLAVCELGVWDKGGAPTGVAIGSPSMAVADIRADATADEEDDVLDYAMDQLGACVDRLGALIP